MPGTSKAQKQGAVDAADRTPHVNPTFAHKANFPGKIRGGELSVEIDETGSLPAPANPPPSRSSPTLALPEGWAAHTTGDGTPYYHNKATNETIWTLPGDQA